uniref:Uncharacterized protein n=1 Tax=Amphora coffeiformis TaxID=265554 RepID=A0A7S3L6S8_9STRA|eukprot:scaffold1506_cov179-Amphora_coffeaeformis.AAC.10
MFATTAASSPNLTLTKRLLGENGDGQVDEPTAKRMKRNLSVQEILLAQAKERCDFRSSVPADFHPHQVLLKMMSKKGFEATSRSFSELDEFFHKPSQDEIDSYGFEVLRAVRDADIDFLRQYHSDGKSLNICNRFGESLLHLACRKQKLSVVDFLLNEASVPAEVCDDQGRTILHDACWTSEPNFDVVDLILAKCPDLLLVKDKRGHTPLFYARREHWGKWLRHLGRNITKVLPKNKRIFAAPIA